MTRYYRRKCERGIIDCHGTILVQTWNVLSSRVTFSIGVCDRHSYTIDLRNRDVDYKIPVFEPSVGDITLEITFLTLIEVVK